MQTASDMQIVCFNPIFLGFTCNLIVFRGMQTVAHNSLRSTYKNNSQGYSCTSNSWYPWYADCNFFASWDERAISHFWRTLNFKILLFIPKLHVYSRMQCSYRNCAFCFSFSLSVLRCSSSPHHDRLRDQKLITVCPAWLLSLSRYGVYLTVFCVWSSCCLMCMWPVVHDILLVMWWDF